MKLNMRIFSKLNLGTPGLLSRSLLFFLYINDLVNCTSVTSTVFCLQMALVLVLELHVQLNWSMTSILNWIQFIAGWKLIYLAQTSTALSIPSKLNLQINSNDILYSTRMKKSVSANQRSTWEYRLIVTLISSPTYNFFAINSLAL